MYGRADHLVSIADRLVADGRNLEDLMETIDPLIETIRRAWVGPAAGRLVAELRVRKTELASAVGTLHRAAGRLDEEARRLRAAMVAKSSVVG